MQLYLLYSDKYVNVDVIANVFVCLCNEQKGMRMVCASSRPYSFAFIGPSSSETRTTTAQISSSLPPCHAS